MPSCLWYTTYISGFILDFPINFNIEDYGENPNQPYRDNILASTVEWIEHRMTHKVGITQRSYRSKRLTNERKKEKKKQISKPGVVCELRSEVIDVLLAVSTSVAYSSTDLHIALIIHSRAESRWIMIKRTGSFPFKYYTGSVSCFFLILIKRTPSKDYFQSWEGVFFFNVHKQIEEFLGILTFIRHRHLVYF